MNNVETMMKELGVKEETINSTLKKINGSSTEESAKDILLSFGNGNGDN